MSENAKPAWTWKKSNINNMKVTEIKILLQNRNSSTKNGTKSMLLKHLKETYEIEDKNMTPFEKLTVKKLKPELILRHLSIRNASKKDLIDRLKINKIPSINTLLVYGYIRENESVLENEQFIPHYLKELILEFSESTIFLYYLTNKSPNNIFIANINNQTKRNWKAKIIDINNSVSNAEAAPAIMGLQRCSLVATAAKSFALPSIIQNSMRKYRKYSTDNYHILFKTSSTAQYNSILLINENEMKLNGNGNEIFAFKYNLPVSHTYGDGVICFDDTYGLLSVGYRFLYTLSFKCDEYLQQNNWRWMQMTPMTYKRNNASIVVIRSNDNKRKLFVVGGKDYYNEKTTEIFDFESNKWTQTVGLPKDKAISKAGICYDNNKQRVYVGGGDSAHWKDYRSLSRVQYFDLSCQSWDILPETVMQHTDYPILWSDKNNPNLLFIGSIDQNGLEYIDLRIGKQWKVIFVPNNTQSLSSRFGVRFSRSNSRLCLTQI